MAEPIVEPGRNRLISFAPLRHKAYARLWTGAFVSNIGTWMESIALGIYVQKHTGQAAWTGTVAAAAFLPIAFFGGHESNVRHLLLPDSNTVASGCVSVPRSFR